MTDEDMPDVRDMIMRGLPRKAICYKHGVSDNTLDRWMFRWGIRQILGDKERVKLLAEVAEFSERTGMSANKLSLAAGLSEAAIRRMRNYNDSGVMASTALKIRNAMKGN